MKLNFISRMKGEEIEKTPTKKLHHSDAKSFLDGKISKTSFLFEIGSQSKGERFTKYQYRGKITEKQGKMQFAGEIAKTKDAKTKRYDCTYYGRMRKAHVGYYYNHARSNQKSNTAHSWRTVFLLVFFNVF